MKIIDQLKNHFTVSFEFFPPKTPEGETDLMDTVQNLEEYDPDFVSVTYGAGGGTRDKTRAIVQKIAEEEHQNVMAHLTCVGHSRQEITSIVGGYRASGIQNILALRGDKPAGSDIDPSAGELPHAADLVRQIRAEHGDAISIGGAAFPEMHPESKDWESDIRYFHEKVNAGLDFAVTQLFFDNRYYQNMMDKLAGGGITIPVIPGIMPITNVQQIQRFAGMCNATIPVALQERLMKFESDPAAVMAVGVEYAVSQCEGLLKLGVPGLHFYTLNKSKATREIYAAVKNMIPVRK